MNIKSILVLCILASLSSLAMAQARYSCTARNGVTYQSDKACPSISVFGPLPERQANTYIQRMGEAPEHLQYLSSRCSTLSEGIRTGQARGVTHEVTAALLRDYQRDCAEDDREARNKVNTLRRDADSNNRSTKQLAVAAQQESQVKQQQCDESKRIIFMKRKRTDLSEGEQLELQKFIQNFRNRCE